MRRRLAISQDAANKFRDMVPFLNPALRDDPIRAQFEFKNVAEMRKRESAMNTSQCARVARVGDPLWCFAHYIPTTGQPFWSYTKVRRLRNSRFDYAAPLSRPLKCPAGVCPQGSVISFNPTTNQLTAWYPEENDPNGQQTYAVHNLNNFEEAHYIFFQEEKPTVFTETQAGQ